MRPLFSLLLTALLSGCSSLPFYPDTQLHGTPHALGLPYEEVVVPTADGETLHGWFIPGKAQGPGSGFTVLFFHGNAGNISHRLESLAIFYALGASTFSLDYRGYGQSTGSPSVRGVQEDARAAWKTLLASKGLKPSQVVLFGRSLGGAVAASLAGEVAPAGLIFESSFTSLYDVASDMFPYLPVSLFLPQDFNTLASLKGKTAMPLLVLHSQADEVIPYHLGRKVFAAYPGPKTFVEMQGSHNRGFVETGAAYVAALEHFFMALR